MTNHMRLASLALALAALPAACTDAPPITSPGPVFSSGPAEIPIFEQWAGGTCLNDGGQLYTLVGTARVQQKGDLYVLVGRGTVSTTDGFTGTFNRTFIFKGDRVTVVRFHDMEVSSATGERMVFSLGMYVGISPDGQNLAVSFEHYGGGPDCPGG